MLFRIASVKSELQSNMNDVEKSGPWTITMDRHYLIKEFVVLEQIGWKEKCAYRLRSIVV